MGPQSAPGEAQKASKMKAPRVIGALNASTWVCILNIKTAAKLRSIFAVQKKVHEAKARVVFFLNTGFRRKNGAPGDPPNYDVFGAFLGPFWTPLWVRFGLIFGPWGPKRSSKL